MKKITYTIGFAFAMLATSNAIAQQGFGTNRPHKSAAVHIESPNKGLLIPNVALLNDTDDVTIKDPELSLLVYNTSNSNGMRPGYYYNSVKIDKTVTPAVGPKWIPFLDASNNTVTAANGLRMDGNTVKLGGTITEDTKIILDTNKKIMIQGLTPVTSMAEQVIAVGHYQTGHVQVATPEQIVTAGLTHNLTSADNVMTSTINGTPKIADIINKNDLSVAITATTPGVVDKVDLTSTVNGVHPATVDIKPAIQAGQIKYEFKSPNNSVGIVASQVVDNKVTVDLTADANNLITVGNGLEKDPTKNDRVVLGGELDKHTTIHTKGFDVKIQGLSVVPNMTNQMIAVGDAGTGLLKVASPKQIVDAGISVTNGISLNATTGAIKLGGALTEKTEIDVTNIALELKGVKSGKATEGTILMHETQTNAVRTVLSGEVVHQGLEKGNGTIVEYNPTSKITSIDLGGILTKPIEFTTTPAPSSSAPANTIAIKGLEPSTEDVKSVVTVDANGVLRQTKLNTAYAVTDVTASLYTVLDSDETLLVDTKTQSIEVKIPAATTENKGKRYYIKSNGNNQTHTHVLKISSTSAIDGSTDPIESSSPYQSWLLQSNGSEWFVIGY